MPRDVPPAGAEGDTPVSIPAELSREIAELRSQIETVQRSVSRQYRSAAPADEEHGPAFESVCSRLLAADLSEDLAREISEAVELQAFAWQQKAANGLPGFEMIPSEAIELALLAELKERFKVSPVLGVPGQKQKRVMFVGSAGAGKTTSLIKLGLRYGLRERLPLHIVSLDTLRVGGWEQIAAFARITGLGFDPVHNLSALEPLLSLHADKKMVLIDTPGFGPADIDSLNNLGHWMASAAPIDTQLVLPATVCSSVVRQTVARFAPLKPAKLLLTHADEAGSPGRLLDIAIRSGLPLSYLSNGQTIPEDIQEASQTDLLAQLGLNRQRRATQAA